MSKSVRMPIEERIERSRESLLCEALADLFHEAAVTDCYVTRALIEALDGGLPGLSDQEFGDMFAEVEDEELSEWFWQAYSRGTAGSRETEEEDLQAFPFLVEDGPEPNAWQLATLEGIANALGCTLVLLSTAQVETLRELAAEDGIAENRWIANAMQAHARRPKAAPESPAPGFGGTEEDLSDLRRTGFAPARGLSPEPANGEG